MRACAIQTRAGIAMFVQSDCEENLLTGEILPTASIVKSWFSRP